MSKFIAGVVFTLVVLGGGLYLYVSRGAFPIGADNPPFKFERRLAMRAMDEHVERHAPRLTNPAQPTPANLIEGAKGYEQHCALCHGGATSMMGTLGSHLNPRAPQLTAKIPDDEDWHLFWVTKHGIRMTGMPSWNGILSDDEMWKVILFIKQSDKLPPEVMSAWQQAATQQQKQ
jgi:mono/diheme cytochrome c family protein